MLENVIRRLGNNGLHTQPKKEHQRTLILNCGFVVKGGNGEAWRTETTNSLVGNW